MEMRDALVIGGGYFGCKVAIALRKQGFRHVLLAEQEKAIMQRASYANQARVHNGYHYPRSLITAQSSRKNFERFCADHAYAINPFLDNVYAIAKNSSVSPSQFEHFCDSIGAPYRPAWSLMGRNFNPDLIEEVFFVRELVFDTVKIAQRTLKELNDAGVELQFQSEVRIQDSDIGCVRATINGEPLQVGYLFNCSYANIDAVGVPIRTPIKRELAELVLVDPPANLIGLGVTVIDGPFFSILPFPAADCYSLSHVRYTPHESWHEHELAPAAPSYSNAVKMIRDASRYMPSLRNALVRKTLFEIKTVMAQAEADDSRPILFEPSAVNSRIISILGAKIDNIYDVLEIIEAEQWH